MIRFLLITVSLASTLALATGNGPKEKDTVIYPGQMVKIADLNSNTVSCQQFPGPYCMLLGADTYHNSKWSFRIAIDDEIVNAAGSLPSAIDKIQQLRTNGLCNNSASGRCKLLGSGEYDGSNWDFRVAIDSHVIAGKGSQNSAIDFINTLKAANLCY